MFVVISKYWHLVSLSSIIVRQMVSKYLCTLNDANKDDTAKLKPGLEGNSALLVLASRWQQSA